MSCRGEHCLRNIPLRLFKPREHLVLRLPGNGKFEAVAKQSLQIANSKLEQAIKDISRADQNLDDISALSILETKKGNTHLARLICWSQIMNQLLKGKKKQAHLFVIMHRLQKQHGENFLGSVKCTVAGGQIIPGVFAHACARIYSCDL